MTDSTMFSIAKKQNKNPTTFLGVAEGKVSQQ